MNPLFDEPNASGPHAQRGYVLSGTQGKRVEPLAGQRHTGDANPAIELIRNKLDALYAKEPNAKQERAETEHMRAPRSKHQQFMHELSASGKSLAEIQTAWHEYYAKLPDNEKQAVWQEFYAANNRAAPSAYTQHVQQAAARPVTTPAQPAVITPLQPIATPHHPLQSTTPSSTHTAAVTPAPMGHTYSYVPPKRRPSVAQIKHQVLAKVRASNNAKLKARHHLQSLAFGFGLGALVLLIFLFSFFNQVIITPFIQPSAHAAATPIILSGDSVAPSSTPEVIIPKINVEIPITYGTSSNENDIENSLEDGVVHYPTTSVPGQLGNAAFFGHSSNNIFNPGKYKFAFVLLHTLAPGDIFYLTYNGQVYTYKVFDRKIVEPTDTWVLNPVAGHTATATLITCDPPGTSLHRLVVWGDQISPGPTANIVAPAPSASSQLPTQLASNGPSLWHRMTHWVTSIF
ncbi:MAG TPA: class D sortase [Patescibacteria group bacterium]|nr:class D sortase [Patescibacteria group bacterium]